MQESIIPIDQDSVTETPSERRRAAARANGLKSRGPKTQEGKARSSQNAIRHGLTSTSFIVHNEDLDQFSQLRTRYIDRFQPVDGCEHDLVDDIVHARWMLLRARLMQNELLNLEMTVQEPALHDRFDPLPEHTRLTLAHDALSNKPELALLLRYESQYTRQYNKAIKTLLEMKKNCPPPPGPSYSENLRNEPKPNAQRARSDTRMPRTTQLPPATASAQRETQSPAPFRVRKSCPEDKSFGSERTRDVVQIMSPSTPKSLALVYNPFT